MDANTPLEKVELLNAKVNSLTEQFEIIHNTAYSNPSSCHRCSKNEQSHPPSTHSTSNRTSTPSHRIEHDKSQSPNTPATTSPASTRPQKQNGAAMRHNNTSQKTANERHSIPVVIKQRFSSATTQTQPKLTTNISRDKANVPRPPNPPLEFTSADNNRPHTATYYIGNINENVSAEVIHNYLYEQNVNVVNLRFFKSKNHGVNAAKIDIHFNEAYIIESPYFWPEGVYARIWHK